MTKFITKRRITLLAAVVLYAVANYLSGKKYLPGCSFAELRPQICLPIFMGLYFGPVYGFTAAFAFSLLQVIQGAYFVHPVQFILDYFVAFTCLGLASFFPKNLPLGSAVGGLARLIASTISGAVFFASYAAEYGFSNAWVYSLIYNFLTIGVDTILCVVVVALPPVQKLFKRVFVKG